MTAWQISRLFLMRLALAGGILWAVFHFMGLIPLVLAVPAAGVLMAKPLMQAEAALFQWIGRQPHAEWQGNYYNFANVHIRMLEVGSELWIVDRDLLLVIGEKPTLMLGSLYGAHEYGLIPGTRLHGFSPAGAEKVLQASAHFEARRMLLWLKREVYKPHARKLEIARGPAP